MKSYAEEQDSIIINWKKELTLPISDDRWCEIKEFSGSWGSCSVGQLSALIDRGRDGEPKDQKLSDLGKAFSNVIDAEESELALLILEKVNKRAMEILQEVLAPLELQTKKLKETIKKMK